MWRVIRIPDRVRQAATCVPADHVAGGAALNPEGTQDIRG